MDTFVKMKEMTRLNYIIQTNGYEYEETEDQGCTIVKIQKKSIRSEIIRVKNWLDMNSLSFNKSSKVWVEEERYFRKKIKAHKEWWKKWERK